MCTASRRERSTTSSRPSVRPRGSPSPRSPGSVPSSTKRWRPSGRTALRPRRVPLSVLRRHLREGPCPRPGRLAGRWSSSPACAQTATVRCSVSTSGTPKTGRSGRRSSAALRERGLSGVRLVISDLHLGLKEAIEQGLHRGIAGSAAGCTSCATRSSGVPKAKTQMVAAAIRTIFAQPDPRTSTNSSTSSPTRSASASPTSPTLLARGQRGPLRVLARSRSRTGRSSGRRTRSNA